MRTAEQIVKRPLLTEKGAKLRESGGRSEHQMEGLEPTQLRTKVLFEVARDANKIETPGGKISTGRPVIAASNNADLQEALIRSGPLG